MSAHLPISEARESHTVLVTGGTGYLGRALLPALLERGHKVRSLVRPGSEKKLPAGIEAMTGNPLDPLSIQTALQGADTLVHLVGVPKPSPAKARQFREVDLVSIRATVAAGSRASPRPHVVYLSVAQPAPVMRAYLAVRAEGEALLRSSGLTATCLRPWYVLGPGHRWPMLLIPIYALLRRIPATHESAERLNFVTLAQMVAGLIQAVENPPDGTAVVTVPQLRRFPK